MMRARFLTCGIMLLLGACDPSLIRTVPENPLTAAPKDKELTAVIAHTSPPPCRKHGVNDDACLTSLLTEAPEVEHAAPPEALAKPAPKPVAAPKKAEPAKAAPAPKAAPKPETPKAESPKSEKPKADTPKAEKPKAEKTKAETPAKPAAKPEKAAEKSPAKPMRTLDVLSAHPDRP